MLRKSIPKPLREAVWRKDNNKFIDGKCWVCKSNSINAFNFECGHIISRKRGGDDSLNNFHAICSLCNKSMGDKNMLDFKEIIWKGRKKNFCIII